MLWLILLAASLALIASGIGTVLALPAGLLATTVGGVSCLLTREVTIMYWGLKAFALGVGGIIVTSILIRIIHTLTSSLCS